MSLNTLDITPTPRILRTLGEIPFQTWQCIAELIDNSIDAFLSNTMFEEQIQKITVTWSSDSVGAMDRTLEVSDNASGMSIDQLQNAVRAGYTSNDPIGNLGLFGMGFIAIQEIIKEYQRQKTNQRSRKGGSARKPQQYH
ncbi:MAG: ATP-binding protein, partial [Clostridiales bacterium]|nr:ATP-binding protein [Clostridiales bacterium]